MTLAIANEPVSGFFNSKSPIFTWGASPDPFLNGYIVTVSVGGTVLHTEKVSKATTQWTYTYAQNTADGGGTPNRVFTFSVVATDNQGNVSTPLSLACTNPSPVAVTGLALSTANLVATVSWNKGVATDWAGTQVYYSTTASFTVPSGGTLLYDGPDTFVTTPLLAGVTLYVLVGQYDNFGAETVTTWTQGSIVGGAHDAVPAAGLASVAAHAVLLGEGTGSFGAATIGTAGRILIDQGASADPLFAAISGDATLSGAGALTIGALTNKTLTLPVLTSYTVAALPVAGTAGRMAFASNLRVFNGAGTQQGAGTGTGGLVVDNGTHWVNADAQSVTAVA